MFDLRLVFTLFSVLFLANLSFASSSSQASMTSASIVQSNSHINLNKATIDELMKVKGMTKSKAKNIVSYRSQQGEFKSITDLKNVKGFKKMKQTQLSSIQNQLVLR